MSNAQKDGSTEMLKMSIFSTSELHTCHRQISTVWNIALWCTLVFVDASACKLHANCWKAAADIEQWAFTSCSTTLKKKQCANLMNEVAVCPMRGSSVPATASWICRIPSETKRSTLLFAYESARDKAASVCRLLLQGETCARNKVVL